MLAAARAWATALRRADPAVERIACIGSSARGDWSVGSDLGVIVILSQSRLTQAERHHRYDPDAVPVPADLWVYTRAEWEALATRSPRLVERLQRETLACA